MPTTADRIGKPRPDGADAAVGEIAPDEGAAGAATPGVVPGGGVRAGLRGIARGLCAVQDAATTVEYALLLLLVSSLCLAMTAMATSLTGALSRAASSLH